MTTRFESRTRRAGLETELKQLRRRLADAWWYERPLEEIQELEGKIAARAQELEELA